MKLALVRQKYTPFGGAERFMDRAVSALRASGTEVAVIARAWQGEQPGTGFIRCDPFHLGRTWRDAGFAMRVQDIIAGGAFDLVQSHERIPGCHIYRAGDGVHATWLELRGRVHSPLQRFATALQPWHRYTLAAEATMFRHPGLRAVICNSRMVRDDIAARFNVAQDKLHLIHNGVDLEYFHPEPCAAHRDRVRAELGIAPGSPLVLFVGSGFERKGLPQLLAAFARLPRRDAQLVVVGRDRREQALRRLAAGLGIGPRVRFMGRQQDVRPYYGAADLFALPTLYDPFPNAALEAMACGLPVVTSTTSGIAELIVPGQNGFVADAVDIAALARHLDAAIAAGSDMGAQARVTAEGLPIAATAEKLLALYDSLLAAGPL
jgi:UDP-glucose:(heptosyl)LPS alpha-1,3-glucosyltransferase